MGGAYGHLSYFTSVALVDVLLIRVLPPLIFAVVAYPVMGLNTFSDGQLTLLWFALILVREESALVAAAVRWNTGRERKTVTMFSKVYGVEGVMGGYNSSTIRCFAFVLCYDCEF